MQTFQVITRGGLTRNIEAESVRRTEHSVEFIVNGGAVIAFRKEVILTIEPCLNSLHPEGLDDEAAA